MDDIQELIERTADNLAVHIKAQIIALDKSGLSNTEVLYIINEALARHKKTAEKALQLATIGWIKP